MITLLLNSYAIIFGGLGGAIITYIFQGIAFSKIAKRRGIKNPWLAWIPVGNLWILGCIADQYRFKVLGDKNQKAAVLLWISVGRMICNALLTLIPLAFMLFTTTTITTIDIESLYSTIYASGIGMGILLISLHGCQLALNITKVVVRYMACWDLFRSCNPKTSKVFFFVGIFTGIALPIFLFIDRNKDLGMIPTASTTPDQAVTE